MLSEDIKIELEDICKENALTIDFDFHHPINVTVRRTMQLNMFNELPEEAYLRFIFGIDNIDIEFVGNFQMDNKLLAKLANKIKRLHYIFLQEHYAQKNYRFKNCIKPVFNISTGDYVAIVKRYYEG